VSPTHHKIGKTGFRYKMAAWTALLFGVLLLPAVSSSFSLRPCVYGSATADAVAFGSLVSP
jgi:hypothetical protein